MMEIQTRVQDLLGRMGVSGGEIVDQNLARLKNASAARLRDLKLAVAIDANKFARQVQDARVEIPSFGHNPAPGHALSDRRALLARTYFRGPGVPVHPSRGEFFHTLFDPATRKAAKLTRLVQENARVRGQFERIAGAAMVNDRRGDGGISLSTGGAGVAVGAMTSAPSQLNNVYDYLRAMDEAVMKQASTMVPGASQFAGLALGLEGSARHSLVSSSEEEEDEDNEWGSQRSAYSGNLTEALPGSVFASGGESQDEGTFKLKRMMDRRSEMYDLYNKMYDKYNQSARQAIDNARA